MDLGTGGTVVHDDADSGFAGYYPTNLFGDHSDLTLDPHCTLNPKYGNDCLKITYIPQGPMAFAGIYWVYPDLGPGKWNWGDEKGRSLKGATRISGWIRAEQDAYVELSIGGINCGKHHDPTKPHEDPYGPLPERTRDRRLKVSPTWQSFTIVIPEDAWRELVIGGLALVLSPQYNPDGAVIYLDDVRYDNGVPDDPAAEEAFRFLRSHTPIAEDGPTKPAAYVYDQALALIYFLSRDDPDSRRRARLLANSLVDAQEHDRHYTDRARWRNAYACGPLCDPHTGAARLPCIHNAETQKVQEDLHQASSYVGDVAWAGTALLSAHAILDKGADDSDFRRAALRAAEWIDSECRREDAWGGYTGGFEGWEPNPEPLEWRSAEHAIDLYVLFSKCYFVTKDDRWRERAVHAREFLLKLWDDSSGCFWMGIRDKSGEINDDARAADPQIWSVLALGHDPAFRRAIGWGGSSELPRHIDWLEANCREEVAGHQGYRFSDKGENIWTEGTGQAAVLHNYLDKRAEALQILQQTAQMSPVGRVEGSQCDPSDPTMPTGGIVAAYPDDAFTGLWRQFSHDQPAEKWKYLERQAVAATCWFLFGIHEINPYWIEFEKPPRLE